jgi:HTH-type transcriptional regulator/antitoxin HigA
VEIKPIRTKTDYRDALKQIESLMTAKANSPEGDRLDVLTTLIEAYERAHFPMDLPDAVEAIKFRMEQSGLTVKDLGFAPGVESDMLATDSSRSSFILNLRIMAACHNQLTTG